MPTLTLNEGPLYYECTGVGAPVLLIHGLGGSARDWTAQVSDLSASYQVITVDLRGHGRSLKPRQRYTIPLFAGDMAALLRNLRLPPAHVVGLSLGGMVAFELALSFPALVRSLVIINSGPEAPAGNLRERVILVLTYLQRVAIVRLFGMRRMGEVLAQRLLPEPEQEHLRRYVVEHWATNDRQAYLSALRAIGGWSAMSRLGQIDCPTLVVAAEWDYTPLDYKRAYCARIPHAELVVIRGSRHLTPLDRPAELNAALLRFLQSQG